MSTNTTRRVNYLYKLKRLLMLPYVFYMRRKERGVSGFTRAALELHYYRPAFYECLADTKKNGNIMYDVNLTADSVVVDIGAYTGEWSEEIAKRFNPKIYAFEPNPHSFAVLEAKRARFPKLTPLPYGVGDKTERLSLSIKKMGSTFFSKSRDRQDVQLVDVEVKAIDECWRELGLQTVDLMKINIEGAEFPLLEKMIAQDLMKNVDCFLIQFHEWYPGAYRRRREIRKELAKTHRVEREYYFVWEKWCKK